MLSDKGYASGGFIADSKVSGTIKPGSQQQYFSRNVDMAKWEGGGWNMVLVGNTNPPAAHCGTSGGSPFTIVEEAPVIAEKPYIIKTDIGYSLMVPRLERNKKGTTSDWENADEIPFSQVYVASDTDSAAKIQEKIDQGLHIVLQPGIYHPEKTIFVR